MTSRSATVLVIFIVAIVAFCLASVFASMTGQISILPNETSNNTTIENLTNSDDGFNYQSYGSQDISSYEGKNQEVHYDTSNDDSDDDGSSSDSNSDNQTTKPKSPDDSSSNDVEKETNLEDD